MKFYLLKECQRQNIDVTARNQRNMLGELIQYAKIELLNDEEIADVARTGVFNTQEILAYTSGQSPTKIQWENPFDSIDETTTEEHIQHFNSISSSTSTSTITNNDNDSCNTVTTVRTLPTILLSRSNASSLRQSSECDHYSGDYNYCTISRFRQTEQCLKTHNTIRLCFTVNQDIQLFGFSIFGFCDGHNEDMCLHKPLVHLHKHHDLHIRSSVQIPVSLPERLAVQVIPLQYMVRFTLKESKEIKANKKYGLEIKLEHVSHGRPRFEGYGLLKPEVKLNNNQTIVFTFESDRNVAELYFAPQPQLQRHTSQDSINSNKSNNSSSSFNKLHLFHRSSATSLPTKLMTALKERHDSDK